ncbi:hypothetical protein JCM10207_008217 [Rhodosporidiobolus poonsookiae]
MDYELAVQGAQDHRRVCIELALQEDTKGIFSEKERNWLRQRLNPTNLMCLGTFISSKSAAIKRAYPPGLFPFSPDPVCAAKLEEKLRYLDDLILSSPTAEAARLFAYSHHRTTESPYFKEARALCPRPEPTYSDIVECYVYEAVSESLETYVEDEVAVSVICRALGSRPQPIIVKRGSSELKNDTPPARSFAQRLLPSCRVSPLRLLSIVLLISLSSLALLRYRLPRPSSLPLCSPAHSTRGTWRRLSPYPTSLPALRAAKSYRPYRALNASDGVKNAHETREDGMYCLERVREEGPTREEREREQGRLLSVGEWEWVGEGVGRGECREREWDWEAVVRRLVSSQHGIVFIGDSITAQQYDSLALLLGNLPTSPLTERVLGPPHRRLDASRALFLSPSHADTARILTSLDVPRARLDRPIARTVRSDFLLSEEARREVGVEGGTMHSDGWGEEVRRILEEGRDDPEYRWKDSLVIVSTGNWWEKWIVQHGGSVTAGLTAYRSALARDLSTFSTLASSSSSSSGLALFYRTLNAGHPSCGSFFAPLAPSPASPFADSGADDGLIRDPSQWAAALDASAGNQNGWFLAPVLNSIAASVLASPSSSASPAPKTHLLDVYDQSLLRPDAHRFPGIGDCLHWCLPGPADEWNKAWWHALGVAEGE